jgi:hypothetical protein
MDWPFDQPPNCLVISVRSIVYERAPILLVSHGADDHGWQFLPNEPMREEDAVVILLKNIAQRDPSVLDVADLPPGWQALRESVDSPWARSPK